jgi:exosome complex RNA-binding protein Rrp42 (RNase PH superfamily)
MTRFALTLAAAVATTCLALPATAAPYSTGDHTFRVAEATVKEKVVVKKPVAKKTVVVRKPVVKKKVVVSPAVRGEVVAGTSAAVVARPGCRTVTTRVHHNGKVVTKKVRRC